MTWPVTLQPDRLKLHVEGRISEKDAARQLATVQEVLSRLCTQPGLVLADEVGMGKTYVALAVAVSVAWAEEARSPVVIMVPSSLASKWPKDFDVFRTHCIVRPQDRSVEALRCAEARSGLEFFKLLDDPAPRRAHIIFVTHGALSRGLNDPWTKLAILRAALGLDRFAPQRRALPRFAADLLRQKSKLNDPDLFAALLAKSPRYWRNILKDYDVDPGDDPVPIPIVDVLSHNEVSLKALRKSLDELPLRSSSNISERLQQVRWELADVIKEIWQETLARVRFRSPLLILDEAHHLKNPSTKLASLFVAEEAEDDAQELQGPLQGRFDRMLFLTATPFQLGHDELINVLDRFRGVCWDSLGPAMTETDFVATKDQLQRSLDAAHLATADLDNKWKLIEQGDLHDPTGEALSAEPWWESVRARPADQPEKVQLVIRAYDRAKGLMEEAERHLAPWVIRHLRSRLLPGSEQPRRRTFAGSAIQSLEEVHVGGLPIPAESILPFMLAARSQAVVARMRTSVDAQRARRALFAEGLASSYEAFLETREAQTDETLAKLLEEDASEVGHDPDGRLRWYLQALANTIPDHKAHGSHPKIAATVNRALEFWRAGEKVLIFCHFRKTGQALTWHLSSRLSGMLNAEAARQLNCSPGEVDSRLENIGRAFDRGRPVYRALEATLDKLLESFPELVDDEKEMTRDVIRRFVRTPSFLVRYFPLEAEDQAAAFSAALEKQDGSGLNLRDKLDRFLHFMARRCDGLERHEYLSALDTVQTGERTLRTAAGADEEVQVLPNIRLANGTVEMEDRRRLLLSFNTPFFPEILIASSVMAEGVDLHLDCRHIIHHDLCWNPSTLEQRTGRIDRIGAKAEQVGKSIQVFLPYIAATQDEKMYRVVQDRQRWFQVLMGESYSMDEASTDQIASRVPLPESAARDLGFRLHVYES